MADQCHVFYVMVTQPSLILKTMNSDDFVQVQRTCHVVIHPSIVIEPVLPLAVDCRSHPASLWPDDVVLSCVRKIMMRVIWIVHADLIWTPCRRVFRGVPRLDGARGKKSLAPNVRTWGLQGAIVLYWRKYLRLVGIFHALQWFGARNTSLSPGPHRYAWSRASICLVSVVT